MNRVRRNMIQEGSEITHSLPYANKNTARILYISYRPRVIVSRLGVVNCGLEVIGIEEPIGGASVQRVDALSAKINLLLPQELQEQLVMPEPPVLGTVAPGHQHSGRPSLEQPRPSVTSLANSICKIAVQALQVRRFQQKLLQVFRELFEHAFIQIIGQLGPRSGQAVDMALKGNAAIVGELRQLNRDRPPLGPLNQLPRNLLVQRLKEQRSYVRLAESEVVDRDLVDFTLQS